MELREGKPGRAKPAVTSLTLLTAYRRARTGLGEDSRGELDAPVDHWGEAGGDWLLLFFPRHLA